jgi:hypothetical protein
MLKFAYINQYSNGSNFKIIPLIKFQQTRSLLGLVRLAPPRPGLGLNPHVSAEVDIDGDQFRAMLKNVFV